MPNNDQWEDVTPAVPPQKGAGKSVAAPQGDAAWEDVGQGQTAAVAPPAASQGQQPGFVNRLAQRLTGYQHPVDEAVNNAWPQLKAHPLQSLYQGVQQFSQGLGNAVMHPVQATGGPEFAEDVGQGNYRGAAGTLAGDILPFAAGAPEALGEEAPAYGTYRPGPSTLAEKMGTAMRREPTEANPKGALTPNVRNVSRATGAGVGALAGRELGSPWGGAAAGGVVGPTLTDWLTPARPRTAPFPDIPEGPTAEGLMDQTRAAVRDRSASWIPMKTPSSTASGRLMNRMAADAEGLPSRPSPTEAQLTDITKSRIVTPEEASLEQQAYGKDWARGQGEGAVQRQNRLLGHLRSARPAKELEDLE